MADTDNYGRNLDKDIANGDTAYYFIDLHNMPDNQDPVRAVRADYQMTSGDATGGFDVSLYVWDSKGRLREVKRGDSGSWSQLGSTVSTTDGNSHSIGAVIGEEDYGFAILTINNNTDSGSITISGDFIHDQHRDSSYDNPVEHATDGNVDNEVYTDGTAQ